MKIANTITNAKNNTKEFYEAHKDYIVLTLALVVGINYLTDLKAASRERVSMLIVDREMLEELAKTTK